MRPADQGRSEAGILNGRTTVFLAALAIGTIGMVAIYSITPVAFNRELSLYVGVFGFGLAVGIFSRRKQMTNAMLTSILAIGSITAFVGAGLVAGIDWLGGRDLLPEMNPAWRNLYLGLVALGAAFVGVRRSRALSSSDPRPKPLTEAALAQPEPAPPRAVPVDWVEMSAVVAENDDHVRTKQLAELQRLDSLLGDRDVPMDERVRQARRTLRQVANRVVTDSAAEAIASDNDVLSQVASVLEWGVQKIPELPEMDLADLLMGKVIADIKAVHDSVEYAFIDHRQLRAIHPISRETAIDKCRERASAAKAALPLIEANGMRLSEEFIATQEELAPLRSVNGFQVVSMGEGNGYVTFEGNGRREALMMAFGDEVGILIEVRVFHFPDTETHDTIIRRVERVRRWKEVVD